ncbi:MAG: hypothetical protein ACAI35_25725 [Candidatus Methylacidiphilales bacterium]|nr:hypothetical protein [Candidatus Methylacidiphilales bacterium]
MKPSKIITAAGFSLVEVVLALGLIVFCMLTLMALLPVGIASDQQSIQQSAAANISAAVLADLKATKAGVSSTLFSLEKPVTSAVSPSSHTFFVDDNGALAGSVDTDASPAASPRYRVEINFVPSTTAGSMQAVAVHVRVTWPALADPSVSYPAANFSGSFEVISALDQN